MNSQETMNLVRQLLTFALAYAAGRGLISADQSSALVSDIVQAIPLIGGAGSILWSVYAHWNMKKVNEKSVAILPSAAVVVPAPGATVQVAGKVVGALLIGFLALHAGPAFAQGKKLAAVTTTSAPSGVPCDPLHLIPGCVGGAPNVLSPVPIDTNLAALWGKIVAATQADLTYAKALADNVNSPGSKLRSQCYAALITANQQANGSTLKNPDGTPMIAPTPAVISQFEQAAELVDNLSATAPVMSACAAAANAVGQSTIQFITGVLASVTAKAIVPIP
jgi:hypothetical protein